MTATKGRMHSTVTVKQFKGPWVVCSPAEPGPWKGNDDFAVLSHVQIDSVPDKGPMRHSVLTRMVDVVSRCSPGADDGHQEVGHSFRDVFSLRRPR